MHRAATFNVPRLATICLGLGVVTLALAQPHADVSASQAEPADPYRWMEGEGNGAFQQWLAIEGATGRLYLDHLPDSAIWRERLSTFSARAMSRRAFQRSNHNLYYIRGAREKPGELWVLNRLGQRRMLLDPQQLDPRGSTASVTAFALSADGTRVAVNIDHGGSEISRIYVVSARDGRPLGDVIERVWGEYPAVWMPDGSGFFYRQLRQVDAKETDSDPLSGMRVRWHRLGTSEQHDLTVIPTEAMRSREVLPVLPETLPAVDVSQQSAWVLAVTSESRTNLRVCVARWPRGAPNSAWSCPIRPEDEVRHALVHEDTLYALSTRHAPTGRVLALRLPPSGVGLDGARVVFPSSAGVVVSGMALARDALYVVTSLGSVDQLYRVSFGGIISRAPMPFAGSIARSGLLKHLSGSPDQDGVIFSLESWLEPRRLYLFDQEGVLDLQGHPLRVTGYEDLATLNTAATSADGTAIPLSIVFRKDIHLDGHNRSILSAYGGYGVMSAPVFQPWMLEWVRAGGVWATAHVRGGGELGEDWHRAGQGPNKGRGVEDLVACAQELARRGYTSPQRTALMGSSMGAVLIGGAVTRFPEAFSAAVIRAGLLNPLRILQATNGANQVGELGDPRESSGFRALLAMDPYQNIKAGVRYPAVLLLVGVNDHRVANWMSGKFEARLRSEGRPDSGPVWIRVASESGHSPGSPTQEAAEYADTFAFLDSQLGEPASRDDAVGAVGP